MRRRNLWKSEVRGLRAKALQADAGVVSKVRAVEQPTRSKPMNGSRPRATARHLLLRFFSTISLAGWGLVLADPFPAFTQCVPVPPGLAGWWTGDNHAFDSAGTNNGVLLQGTTFAPGKVGLAFSFDGVDDEFQVPCGTALAFGPNSDLSAEAWIRASPNGSIQPILGKRLNERGTGGIAIGFELFLADGKLSCQLAPQGQGYFNVVSAGPILTDVNFHHVAMTVARGLANGGKLYLDGQVITAFDTTGVTGDLTTTDPVRIGGHPLQTYHFKGLIDEAGIYQRALSAAEIQGIYSASVVGKCPLPPSVARPPADIWCPLGSNATLTVAIAGTHPMNYQWCFNDTPITNILRFSGTTSNVLVFTDAQSNDAGNYFVIATNIAGAVTSSVAQVHIGSPPLIVLQPNSQTNLFDQAAQFAAGAVGDAPLSYQWFRAGDALANDARHAGVNATELVISGLTDADDGNYFLVATNPFGAATSAVATLTVRMPPVITQQPVYQAGFPGGLASFSSLATGFGPIGYHWFHDGLPLADDTRHSGAASNVLSLANLQTSDAGYYWVVATNVAGAVTSSIAYLHLQPVTLLNVDFGVVRPSGKVGAAAIGQGTNDFWNSYEGAGNSSNAGMLSFLKFANRETNFLSQAGLTVTSATGNWGNGSTDVMYQDYVYALAGGTYTITVINLPSGTYDFYLYSYDGKFRLTVGGRDYGTKTSLDNPVANPPAWQEGRQYVRFASVGVTNPGASVAIQSSPGTLGYAVLSGLQIAQFVSNGLAPTLWLQPENQNVTVSSNFTLRVLASGEPWPASQWFKDGTPLADFAQISGATSNVLTISSAQPGDAGNYHAVCSNDFGAVTSAVAVIQVGYPPVITQQPASLSAITGSVAQFTVQAVGEEPLTYRWYQSNTALTNDTRHHGTATNMLSITNLATTDAGNYTVRVTNAFGFAATSSVAVLSVFIPPTIITQPRGGSVPVGLPVSLTATAAGTSPKLQWLRDGVPVPAATNSSLVFSRLGATDFGAYQLVATNFGGAITSVVAQLTRGNVAIWGTNSGSTPGPIWPAAGLSNAVAVGAGVSFSAALRSDGTVYAWGVGTTATNVPATVYGIVALAVGNGHVVGLRSNGTVVVFGSSSSALLNVPASATNVVTVTAGASHCVALRADGTVVAWGSSSGGNLSVPGDLRNVQSVDGGYQQTLALLANGRVTTWGGTALAVPSELTNVIGISAAPSTSRLNLALTADGKVRAWGDSGAATNLPPGLGGVRGVEGAGGNASGSGVTFVINSNRIVSAWGGTPGYYITNVPPGLSNVVALSGAMSHALALIDDGPPLLVRPPVGGTFFTGRELVLKAKAIGNPPIEFQWFKDGVLLDNETNTALVIPSVQSTNAGLYRVMASNALGVAQSVIVPVTVMDRAPTLMSQPVSQTAYFGSPLSIGASVIGSGPLAFQWWQNGVLTHTGTNELLFDRAFPEHAGSYQLVVSNALGAVTSSVAQITVSRAAVWGSGPTLANAPVDLATIRDFSSAYHHLLAIKSDGTVAAWGTTVGGATNVPVGLSNVVAVTGGRYFSVALRADGTAAAWGTNNFGQTSIPASATNLTVIVAGGDHVLALRSNGTVVAWGDNSSGQRSVPVGLSNVVAISAGQSHSVALRADGTAVTWGLNASNPPYLTNLIAVAAGLNQSFALCTDGTLITWMSGGQTLPAGLTNVVALASGGTYPLTVGHTVALQADGSLIVFGTNSAGQLNVPPELVSSIKLTCGYTHMAAFLGDRLPVITVPPWDRRVPSGSDVTIVAPAVGQPALSYQWRFKDADLPGATSPNLTLASVSRNARGYYQLQAANSLGVTLSRAAQLDVGGPLHLQLDVDTSGGFSLIAQDAFGGSIQPDELPLFEVQASTNLLDWETLTNSLVLTNGVLRFLDAIDPSPPVRFYRLLEH